MELISHVYHNVPLVLEPVSFPDLPSTLWGFGNETNAPFRLHWIGLTTCQGVTGTVKKGSPAYYLWRRARYIRTDEKSAVDYASYGGQDDNPNTVALGRLQCSSVHTVVTQCANVITAASRTPCKMCKCATAVVAIYFDCKF